MSRSSGYGLSAGTIFLSAFLIFQIQLITAKALLPWFGGSSSVWATSMVFFTGMLFLGYLYAGVLTRFPHEKQMRIHLALIFIGIVWVSISLIIWHSIAPPFEWIAATDLPPAPSTLLVLFLTIGLSYFLLSTTSPLIQYWYGMTAEREPYSLYAISNIGSFLALLSYPFVVEPFTTLRNQKVIWAAAFLLYAGLSVTSCLWARPRKDAPASPHSRATIEKNAKLWWVLYALFPSFMLIAVTTHITQVIAPIPLLWMVPLSLYLLTFIIAFGGVRTNVMVPAALVISAAVALRYSDLFNTYDYVKIGADLVSLFFLALYCHGELYKVRPPREHSAVFYVYISFGGMVGALLPSIVAPRIFNDYWEFPLGCAISILIGIYAIARSRPLLQPRLPQVATVAAAAALIAYAFVHFAGSESSYLMVTRNFYGTTRVYQDKVSRVLFHGTTQHGVQFLDPKLEHIPTSYYGPDTVLGTAIMFERAQHPDKTISLGVLGLGVGTMAAYCGKGDSLTFYEIDRRISTIARDKFTYLAQCPQAQIHFGDARVSLDKEYAEGRRGNYDLIVVDAFVDDAIPVHLITREAIARYVSHLRGPAGVVAVHVTNRHLDLAPMLMSIAREERLSIFLADTVVQKNTTYPARWVLLCRQPIFEGGVSLRTKKPVPAWTDDYSNLLSVMMW